MHFIMSLEAHASKTFIKKDTALVVVRSNRSRCVGIAFSKHS